MSARDDVEFAYQVASDIALALLNISSASDDDRWPDGMYFAMLSEALKQKAAVDAACEWIPPHVVHACVTHGPNMHDALLVLAHAAVTTDLLAQNRSDAAKQRGMPSAKDWFKFLAGYPAGTVTATLNVERAQALHAIKVAEAEATAATAMGKERAAAEIATEPGNESPQDFGATHSIDFRSVRWYGTGYSFTPNQAACVKVLWQHWEQGTPEVGDAAVLTEAGIETERIDKVFRNNNAWGAMIVDGATKGTHRLERPRAAK